jgi:hypothetical protein
MFQIVMNHGKERKLHVKLLSVQASMSDAAYRERTYDMGQRLSMQISF